MSAMEALTKAWAEVPDEYTPSDDDQMDLAVAIAQMADDLREHSLDRQQLAKAREAIGVTEYRRGRVELAEELSALVGGQQPSKASWHYVMGALDIITNKAEVMR